jgi:Na+/phosphate symporter
VDVSGSVGCIESASTLTSASAPSFGAIAPTKDGTVNITYTLNQGTKAVCGSKSGATVSAAVTVLTGSAATEVDTAARVTFELDSSETTAAIPVKAKVPSGATTNTSFGATVALTLTPGT